MDRLLYTAMSGARQLMEAQAVNSHNLANVSTIGFRADLHAAVQSRVPGAGLETRVQSVGQNLGWNQSVGPQMHTGRELDVAVQGTGFIAVQARDGSEGYSRAGDLRVDENGLLRTGAGLAVLGDGGAPIAVPQHSSISIGEDGTVSIVPLGQTANTSTTVDRIRLVNPDPALLAKGSDGLLRMNDGSSPASDAAVTLRSGTLEGSNVNAANALVEMIQIARQYEMQVKLMTTVEENDQRSSQLLRLG